MFAQALQPGEWQFNATTTSPLFPAGQASVFRRCIHKEDAENPERWMVTQKETGPCKLIPGEKTPTSLTWRVSCPATNTHGSGVAWLTGPGALESEIRMTSELQGYRIETNTRASGRRLGPCKS